MHLLHDLKSLVEAWFVGITYPHPEVLCDTSTPAS